MGQTCGLDLAENLQIQRSGTVLSEEKERLVRPESERGTVERAIAVNVITFGRAGAVVIEHLTPCSSPREIKDEIFLAAVGEPVAVLVQDCVTNPAEQVFDAGEVTHFNLIADLENGGNVL